MEVIETFFADTIWRDANVPKIDADRSAPLIRGIFDDFVEYKIASQQSSIALL